MILHQLWKYCRTLTTKFSIGRRFVLTYSIQIKRSAYTSITHLDPPTRRRIVRRIDRLAEKPFTGVRLKGELKGLWRVREGDYRIIYELREAELVVLVLRVAHRREAYREKL
jgi:mRNA interferase RelE/StbE